MQVYKSRARKLSGTSYSEIKLQARALYKIYTSRTKRRPYVRSLYFNKDKIFLSLFWAHIWDKNWSDRNRRLKLLPCGLDLIKNSRFQPSSKQNPNKKSEIIHKFAGVTKEGELFFVHIKEGNNGDKHLMSIFPFK